MIVDDTLPPEEVFSALGPRLFSIAYRMLGIRADAEDVVQDAWLRRHGPLPFNRGSVCEVAVLAIFIALPSFKRRREGAFHTE